VSSSIRNVGTLFKFEFVLTTQKTLAYDPMCALPTNVIEGLLDIYVGALLLY
jgi:hypothetical protein